MRPDPDQIKAAILHADQDVRRAAVEYFTGGGCDDPTIMSLVIEAVERYGWEAFKNYGFLDCFDHTSESAAWLIRQIQQSPTEPTEVEEFRTNALRRALLGCRPAVLNEHRQAIGSLAALDETTQREVDARVAVGSMSAEELWAALESYCDAMQEDPDGGAPHRYDHARYLAIALGAHGDAYGGRVVEVLKNHDRYGGWFEVFAVVAVGEMRLPDSITPLIDQLEVPDAYACTEAILALAKIGSDDVVDQLAIRAPGNDEIEFMTAGILEEIHTDRSVKACFELLAKQEDEMLQGFLLRAILAQFDSDGIEPARQHVLKQTKDPELLDVRDALLTACKLLNRSFPEFDAWLEDSKHNVEFRQEWYQKFANLDLDSGDLLGDEFEGEDFEDGEFDELDEFDALEEDWDEWDDELGDDGDGGAGKKWNVVPLFGPDESTSSGPAPIRRAQRVGRNDPCPCGSGKKHKKCCWGKQG